MSETNAHIYERVIEAFNRDGVAGAMRFFSEDAEVYDPDAPAGRPYRGRAAVARFLAELTFGSQVEVRDFHLVSAGDRVVGLIYSHRSRADGAEVGLIEAHTLTFREGKVEYWRVYLDPEEALADVGLDLASIEAAGLDAP